MNAGIIQQLLAFRDAQETGGLLKSLWTQLRHLFELCAAGEGAVFFAVSHNVLRSGCGESGDLLQQAGGRRVHIHTHCVDAILHHSAQRRVQFLLRAIVLILANTDGLRIDFDQFGQRVLQSPCDGHGRTQIHIEIRKFFRRKGRGGIDGRTRFADDHIAGIRVPFQQLDGPCLRFPGGSAVSDGNVLHTVAGHQTVEGLDGLLLLAFAERRIYDRGGKYLAGRIHNCHLAAVAVSGVKPHGHKALHRRLHQKGLQIQREIVNGAGTGPFCQIGADFPLNGGEDQAFVGILRGGAHEGRHMHRWLQCRAAHQSRTLVAGENHGYLQEAFLLAAVDGENLMILQPRNGLGKVVVEPVNGVGFCIFCLAGQQCLSVHQLPHLLADGCIVGQILCDNIAGACKSLLNGGYALFLTDVISGQHSGIPAVLRKNGGSQGLQSLFPGNTGAGAAFLLIGSV